MNIITKSMYSPSFELTEGTAPAINRFVTKSGNTHLKAPVPENVQEAAIRVEKYYSFQQSFNNVLQTIFGGKDTDKQHENDELTLIRFILKSLTDRVPCSNSGNYTRNGDTSQDIIQAARYVFGTDAEAFLINSIREQAIRVKLSDIVNTAKAVHSEARAACTHAENAFTDPTRLAQLRVNVADAAHKLEVAEKNLQDFNELCTGINFDIPFNGSIKIVKDNLRAIKNNNENRKFHFKPDFSLTAKLLELVAMSLNMRIGTSDFLKVYAKTPQEVDKIKMDSYVITLIKHIQALPDNVKESLATQMTTPQLSGPTLTAEQNIYAFETCEYLQDVVKFIFSYDSPETYDKAVTALEALARVSGAPISQSTPKVPGALTNVTDFRNPDIEENLSTPFALKGALTDTKLIETSQNSLYGAWPLQGASSAAIPIEKASQIGLKTVSPVPEDRLRAEALRFETMATELSKSIRFLDPKIAASKAATDMLYAMGHPDLNPEKVFLVRTNFSEGDDKTYTGYKFKKKNVVKTESLVDVVLRNFYLQEREDGEFSSMNQLSGFYLNVDDKTDEFGVGNEVRILPSAFQEEMEKYDFMNRYRNEAKTFWAAHKENFRTVLKGVMATAAGKMNESGKLTEEGYKIVMDAVAPELMMQQGYLGSYQPQATLDILRRDTQVKGNVRHLAIYGYPSNILLFNESGKAFDTSKIVAFIPETHQYVEFDNSENCFEWIIAQARDDNKRDVLLRSFNLYNQEDGMTYSGVRTAVNALARGDSSWMPVSDPYRYLREQTSPITGGLFDSIQKQVASDFEANAEKSITSNTELTKRAWLEYISTFSQLAGGLIPLSEGVPAIAAELGASVAAGAMTGIGISDVTQGKVEGVYEIADGVITFLFNRASGTETQVKQPNIQLLKQDVANARYTYDVVNPNPIVGNEETISLNFQEFADVPNEGGNINQVQNAIPVKISSSKAGSSGISNLELDITNAEIMPGESSATANGARRIIVDGKLFYDKQSVGFLPKFIKKDGVFELNFIKGSAPDAMEQAFFSDREVKANRISRLLSTFENVPDTYRGITTSAEGSKLYSVTSAAIENFYELDALLKNDVFVNDQLKELKADLPTQVKIKKLIKTYQSVDNEVVNLIENINEEWYYTTNIELNALIQQRREAMSQALDAILTAEQKEQVFESVCNAIIMGESDHVNYKGQNIGLMKTPLGKWNLMVIDRGVSLDMGFMGSAKDFDGFEVAKNQRPPALHNAQESIYTETSARFTGELPPLSGDLSMFPYPEDVNILLGEGVSKEISDKVIKKMALKYIFTSEGKGLEIIFNPLFDTMYSPPTQRLLERGFMNPAELKKIMYQRFDGLLKQAGGRDLILAWAHQNHDIARDIAELAAKVRLENGLQPTDDLLAFL